MSLTGALNIGRTALAINQAALQTVGNNIANAGNADYTRQVTNLSTAGDVRLKPGIYVGQGVKLDGIARQIDEALQGRLRNSVSDNEGAGEQEQWLGRVESVFNELTDDDLSTQLSTFFNGWSDLANKPQDVGLRQVVLQNGGAVADWFHQVGGQLSALSGDVDERVTARADDADNLAGKIAELNGQIVVAEGGTHGQANGLRDQRDAVIKQLSGLMDIRTVEQPSGVVNVYVGSEPLVFDTTSRGVTTRNDTVDGTVVAKVVFKSNGGELKLETGQLGGLIKSRDSIREANKSVDDLASELIFELNKIHGSGQGLTGVSSVTSSNTVEDPDLTLNDPENGLKGTPVNGSFVVHVKDKATGLVTSTLVQVDLDGTGGDDTTLNSLVTDLDGIANISATNAGGRLRVTADSKAVEISFSQDSSGALATLGVNNFFTGSDASDIAVSETLKKDPTLLAAAKNGEKGDNQTARAIANLETTALRSLNGSTLKAKYESIVNTVATESSTASNTAEAAKAVKETLEAQREALSGVSMDEEALNLMKYQRAFQGAARLVSVIDEMMQTVIAMAA